MSSIVGQFGVRGLGAHASASATSQAGAEVVQLPRRASTPDYAGMLAAIAVGDRRAEDQLMRALTPPLEVVLRHRARNAEGVDDLCQDALIAVLQAAREGRIEDPVALVEYALQTARQLALNAERKRERRQTFSVGEMIEPEAPQTCEASETLAGEQLRGCVSAVLASLPSARDRQLLQSYYLQETPSAELQAQMSMDSAQLGKVLHRARQRFGNLWRSLKFDPPQS